MILHKAKDLFSILYFTYQSVFITGQMWRCVALCPVKPFIYTVQKKHNRPSNLYSIYQAVPCSIIWTPSVQLSACIHHFMFTLDMSTCGVSVTANTERLRGTARGAWNLLEELRLLVCVCAGHQCCGEGLVISSWACVPLGAITVEWSRCLQTHARTHTHRKLKWTVSLSPHCLSASVSPWVFLSATNPAILPVWQGAFYCVFHHRLPCFWSLSVFHTSRLLDKTYESLEMCMWSLLTIDKVTEMHAALVPSQRSTFGVWVVWPEDNGQQFYLYNGAWQGSGVIDSLCISGSVLDGDDKTLQQIATCNPKVNKRRKTKDFIFTLNNASFSSHIILTKHHF